MHLLSFNTTCFKFPEIKTMQSEFSLNLWRLQYVPSDGIPQGGSDGEQQQENKEMMG